MLKDQPSPFHCLTFESQGDGGDTGALPAAAATAVTTTARMAGVAESLKLQHQFTRVPMEHFRKTIIAKQRCAEEEVSTVLSDVEVASVDDSMSREDAVTHLTSLVSRGLVLVVDVYNDKI